MRTLANIYEHMRTINMPFMGKLAELGYVDGENVVIERRSADGNPERLADLAADLVRQQVNVIVTAGTPAGFAAKKATSTIPIVLGANSDPVGVGLVASLARPGGNMTGNSLMAPDLSQKRLELLHMLGPGDFPLCDPLGFVKPRHGGARARD